MNNNQVLLTDYARGFPKESDLYVTTSSIKLKVGEESSKNALLVKNLYLSCDPFMRGRMLKDLPLVNHPKSLPTPLPLQLLEMEWLELLIPDTLNSRKAINLVWGRTIGWEEYSLITTPEYLFKIHHTDDVPLSYYIGILGMPGLTAYVGFFNICSPKKGEVVYISAASGAVGQIVGQFAKLIGCHVVGSAGSKEKVELLNTKFGFDDAFNYKEEYYDLDAALKRLGWKALRLSATMTNTPSSWILFLPSIKEGKIVYVEDIAEGLESGPAVLSGLFSGRNVGKRVVKVSQE